MKIDAVIISKQSISPIIEGFDGVLTESGHQPAAQRNRCIARSTADVIVLIDDDATPIAGYADAVRRIMSDPSVAGCGGPSIPHPDASPMTRLMHRVMATASDATWLRYATAHEQSAAWQSFAGCSFAFRKSCGILFDESFPAASGEDMDFQRRVAQHGKLIYSPALAVYHNPHPLGQQLARIYRWGRDNQGGQSSGMINVLFPFLWIVAMGAFFAGIVAGKITNKKRMRSGECPGSNCRK